MPIDNEEVASKARTVKARVEENSEVMKRIVDQLVLKHSRELNTYVDEVKALLKSREIENKQLTDIEIEQAVLKIPLYLYFTAEGLESLGIEGEAAKAVKMEAFNEAYTKATGTINDKTALAENLTFPEHLIEVCYTRAYKRLKLQIEVAMELSSAAKKILSKRMQDVEVHLRDPGYYQGGQAT